MLFVIYFIYVSFEYVESKLTEPTPVPVRSTPSGAQVMTTVESHLSDHTIHKQGSISSKVYRISQNKVSEKPNILHINYQSKFCY